MSNCPLVRWAAGTGATLIGFDTSVTVKVPDTRGAEIDVMVKVPAPPAWPLSQFWAPSTIVTVPCTAGVKSRLMVAGGEGGIDRPPPIGPASVMTRKLVSCPVMAWNRP
jgi:hypothetical protein